MAWIGFDREGNPCIHEPRPQADQGHRWAPYHEGGSWPISAGRAESPSPPGAAGVCVEGTHTRGAHPGAQLYQHHPSLTFPATQAMTLKVAWKHTETPNTCLMAQE